MRKACAGWSLPSVPDVFLVFAYVEQVSKKYFGVCSIVSKSQEIILSFAKLLARRFYFL